MKISTQIFVTLFCFFLGMSHLAAKEQGQITGTIKDEAGMAVPFVNISLIDAASASLLTGAVSDENGNFLIETSKTGEFQIMVSSIGFETFKSETFELKPGMKKSFDQIKIKEEAGNLSEVTIRSTRPEIIIEADKTTINIEGTVMAEGNTALDVIGRSPGVYVDENDNIILNGRGGVTVMINDRQTYMSANDLANFLRSMQLIISKV